MTEQETDHLTARERRLFEQLPRESAPPAAEAERLVAALRSEGFFRRRAAVPRLAFQLAAAIALLVIGGVIGARLERRGSLEELLDRDNLAVSERVLLLQRAGSAYVRAAHAYASATATADSTAVEVASQVLRGAAGALVKSNLNSTVSSGIVNVLQAADRGPRQPLIWY